MRAKYLVIGLCLAAALGPASAVEVAPEDLVETMGLKAGRWHTVGTVESVELTVLPGGIVPDGLNEQLQEQQGLVVEGDDCIGPGLADNGQLILPALELGCPISRMGAQDGQMSIAATCGASGSHPSDMEFEASYTDETMEGSYRMTSLIKDQGYTIEIVFRTSSAYAGECPPGLPATPRPLTNSYSAAPAPN